MPLIKGTQECQIPKETKVITSPNNAIDQRNTGTPNTKGNEGNYFPKQHHQSKEHRNNKYQRKRSVITSPNNAIDQRNTGTPNTKGNKGNYFPKQRHRSKKYRNAKY